MPIPERPQALQRQSAKSVVYQTVCDWIITGVMKPGEKILDSELASYLTSAARPCGRRSSCCRTRSWSA